MEQDPIQESKLRKKIKISPKSAVVGLLVVTMVGALFASGVFKRWNNPFGSAPSESYEFNLDVDYYVSNETDILPNQPDSNIAVPASNASEFKDTFLDHGRFKFGTVRWDKTTNCKPIFIFGDSVPNKDLIGHGAGLNDNCPKSYSILNLRDTPVAVSVAVRDGEEVYRWLNENPEFGKFSESDVFKGLFDSIGKTLKIRGEDVFSGSYKGEFVKLMAESIVSDGQLFIHYDALRGKNSLVFSFRQDKATAASSVLRVLIPRITKRSFNVKALGGRVFEILLGTQRLFVASDSEMSRMYFGYSMTALLNVMSKPLPVFPESLTGNVAGSVRLESWLNPNIMKALSGKQQWQTYFSFNLNEKETAPRKFLIENSSLFESLTPKLGEGIAASVPHDAFFGMGLSLPVPKRFSAEKMVEQLEKDGILRFPLSDSLNPDEGGVGLIWDLDGSTGQSWVSKVGMIISAGSEGAGSAVQQLGFNENSTIYCKTRNVFLFSRDESLLTRMSEACNGDSPSILSWQGQGFEPALLSKQSFAFMNPEVLLTEAFSAGGALEAANKVESDDSEVAEQLGKALDKMVKDSRTTFSTFSVIGFAGEKSADHLAMSGFISRPRK